MIGGVSGGLAEYSGIDALLWRVGFVALTLAGGTGIVVYLLLWLLMPAGPVGPWAPDTGRQVPTGPRSPVPGLTVAALLIVVGGLALLDRFTVLDPGPRVFLGAALLVVAAGLVAAAFSGGRTGKGGLITLGVILSLALIAASSMPWHGSHGFGGEVGERTYRPASAGDVRPVYEGDVGELTLDLSRIDLAGLEEPIETRIEHGLGDVAVIVPRSADVEIEASMGMGSADVLGQRGDPDGFYPGTGTAPWTGDDRPEIMLTIDHSLGDVEVSRD